MSEKPTTYNVVELTRGLSEARTLETTLAYFGPDSVYDMSQMGMGVFHGPEAIRGFLDDWDKQYEEYDDEIVELVGLSQDVAYLAVRQNARPSGSPAHVRLNDVYGYAVVWAHGKVERITPYTEATTARAAAERLAKERG